MLESNGYAFKSENGSLLILKVKTIITRGIKKNGLYVLEGSTVVGISSSVTK